MSKQLYEVGHVFDLDGNTFEIVKIDSEEGKTGTYWTYGLRLQAEVQEAAQYAKAAAVAQAENAKLEPVAKSDDVPAEETKS